MTFLSDLLALPPFLLFTSLHLLSSLIRPLLLLSLLLLLTNPSATVSKLKLFYTTFLYLAFCKDKKFKIPNGVQDDPAMYFVKDMGGTAAKEVKSGDGSAYKSKTVILVRHGESTWNDTFNAGDRNKFLFVLGFVPGLIYALVVEVYFFVSGRGGDSWFFDSALSMKGVKQSEGLRKFLKKEKMRLGSSGGSHSATSSEERAVKLLLALETDGKPGAKPSSHVVSSNLRRAISTAAIGLSDRFARTAFPTGGASKSGNDDILLLPSLQEISKNPDALTILPARGVAHPTWCDNSTYIPALPNEDGAFSALVNTTHHGGNKPISSNGLLRLKQFCADIFNSSLLPRDTVIAAGHSLFFRSLFQMYLPRGVEHVSKKKKLVNGGVVMFTLWEVSLGGSKKEYMIDPNSVVVVYGGFGKHTKG